MNAHLMAKTGPILENMKVLVVDDNKNTLQMIAAILRAIGVRDMNQCMTADKALGQLSLYQPDVIITDWHMAPMDGVEFTKQVRQGKQSANRYVPIIMLTGHMEMSLVVNARDAGVNEFLIKPVAPKALYARIMSVLESKRPFIQSKAYFGPCRRRKNEGPPAGKRERRDSNKR